MGGATCTVSAACCTRCLLGIHRLPAPLCRRYLPAMRWTPCPRSGRCGGRYLPPWNWQFNGPWPRRRRTDLRRRGVCRGAGGAAEPHPRTAGRAPAAQSRPPAQGYTRGGRGSPPGYAGWFAVAPPSRSRSPALDPKRVAVANFTNNTGDTALATLGERTADRLASGLTEIQLVQVVDARAEQDGGGDKRGRGSARTARWPRDSAPARCSGGATTGGATVSRSMRSSATPGRGQVLVPIRAALGPAADPSSVIEQLRHHAMAALAWHSTPQLRRSRTPTDHRTTRPTGSSSRPTTSASQLPIAASPNAVMNTGAGPMPSTPCSPFP